MQVGMQGELRVGQVDYEQRLGIQGAGAVV